MDEDVVSTMDENALPCNIHRVTLLEEDIQHVPALELKDVAVSVELAYCAGNCHWHIPAEVNVTRSGYLQAAIASILDDKMPEPCCAPGEYEEVIYPSKDGGLITLTKVKSCECR